MMASRGADIRGIVERLLAERFADARIVSVDVKEDVDPDGDPILRVTVVYDTESGRLDAANVAGVVRRLRPLLDREGEGRFPVMSFISKADSKGPHPEAA